MILLHGTMNPEMCIELFELLPQELSLEELCNKYSVAVVIPLMKNRYYISDEKCNCDQFIAEEIPRLMKEKYKISDSKEYILAGISMGAYGATLVGARTTGVFKRIISISGAYIAHDVEIGNPVVWGDLRPDSDKLDETFLYYFLPLEDLEQSVDRNAMAALSLITRDETMIVATCGTKDWLYSRNLEFVKAMDKNQLSYKFFEIEAGMHDAECFKEGLRKAIEYLEDMD